MTTALEDTVPYALGKMQAALDAGSGSREWLEYARLFRIAFSALSLSSTIISLRDGSYGAVGDGVADDRSAIQNALNAAGALVNATASGKVQVVGNPGDVYLLSSAPGNVTVSTSTGRYCLKIPPGVTFDGRGATLRAAPNIISMVAMVTNANPAFASNTDTNIGLVNWTLDGNYNAGASGNSTLGGSSFCGITKLKLYNLLVTNVGGSAGMLLINCSQVDGDRLDADTIYGNAFIFGIAAGKDVNDSRFGRISARNCFNFDGATLVGNPFVMAGTDVVIDELIAKNCDGGFKFAAPCQDINIGLALWNGGTTNNETNCGLKFQGNSTNGNCTRVHCAIANSSGGYGPGLFMDYAIDCGIGQYIGNGMGQSGADPDVSISATCTGITAGSLKSESAGAVGILCQATNFRFEYVYINNCGRLTNSDAVSVQGISSDGYIGTLVALADASDGKFIKAFNVTAAGEFFRVGNLRTKNWFALPFALGNSIKNFVDNPQISTQGLLGSYSPSASTTGGSVGDSNTRTNLIAGSAPAFYAVPVYEIVPMNASARALPIKSYISVASQDTIFFSHASAVGTEVYLYRLKSYIASATQMDG